MENPISYSSGIHDCGTVGKYAMEKKENKKVLLTFDFWVAKIVIESLLGTIGTLEWLDESMSFAIRRRTFYNIEDVYE